MPLTIGRATEKGPATPERAPTRGLKHLAIGGCGRGYRYPRQTDSRTLAARSRARLLAQAGVDRSQVAASAQVEAAMLGMRLPSLTRSALSSSRPDYPNSAPTKFAIRRTALRR
jgi:hypothetical protein